MPHCASKVVILATGGTIVSSGASATQMTGYSIQGLGVEDLLSAVPMLADVADVEAARVSNIDSSSMTSEVWLKLANAVEEALRREDVSGVVITHGTDTMEETAFFLNLVVKSEKPVVLTGAMRPATALSAEGPLNLLNAVRIAADPKAAGRGVLIALNDVIVSARDATKTHPTNVATFRGPDLGMLGMIAGTHIEWIARSEKPHGAATPFTLEALEARVAADGALPRVDIVYSHVDDDGVMVRAAMAAGARQRLDSREDGRRPHGGCRSRRTRRARFENPERHDRRGTRRVAGCGLRACRDAQPAEGPCARAALARLRRRSRPRLQGVLKALR